MKLTPFIMLGLSAIALASCSSTGGLAPNQQLAMSKQACAEVGMTPGTEAFSSCFINTDASLRYDENLATH